MLKRMWPIAWELYPDGAHEALTGTIHIATIGTVLAVLMAIPIRFIAARNVVRNAWLNDCGKLILVSPRSLNTLIRTLFFVAVFGPGVLAGTLAIASRSIGFTGKLLAEALKETDPGTIEALQAADAS